MWQIYGLSRQASLDRSSRKPLFIPLCVCLYPTLHFFPSHEFTGFMAILFVVEVRFCVLKVEISLIHLMAGKNSFVALQFLCSSILFSYIEEAS